MDSSGACHILVDNFNDRLSRFCCGDAQGIADGFFHDSDSGLRIEHHAATGKVFRIESFKHQIRIGDRSIFAAAAVTCRTRL